MKNSLIALIIIFLSFNAHGQNNFSIPFSVSHNCSEKFGYEGFEGDYVLNVIVTETSISFNTREGQTMSDFEKTKETNKYVVGKTGSGNYLFFNKEAKQLYFIDYFMSRHTIGAYGEGYSDIKNTVLKMMEKLKNGESQKEVMAFMIKQVEYDF